LALDILVWLYWGIWSALTLLQRPLIYGLLINPVFHYAGVQNFFRVSYTVLKLAAPVLSLGYISALFNAPRIASVSLLAFASVRAYRYAWQFPSRCMLEVRGVGELLARFHCPTSEPRNKSSPLRAPS
jgi:hypothetical protein